MTMTAFSAVGGASQPPPVVVHRRSLYWSKREGVTSYVGLVQNTLVWNFDRQYIFYV